MTVAALLFLYSFLHYLCKYRLGQQQSEKTQKNTDQAETCTSNNI